MPQDIRLAVLLRATCDLFSEWNRRFRSFLLERKQV